ncbi:ATP synthase F0 subunit B [Candidatus Parcubacteria bacterium]|nr:MAG: ATP synthase F0 subunit B [Candidatus Parcubacteria bacterium]
MQELLTKLGIDWKLLLAQIVNFLVLLLVLKKFVYQPIIHVLHERKRKIQEGIEKAARAEERLKEAGEYAKEKLNEAEQHAVHIIRDAEKRGKEKEQKIIQQAHQKERELLQNAERLIAAKALETKQRIAREAEALVRDACARLAHLAPEQFDKELIAQAVREAAKNNSQ